MRVQSEIPSGDIPASETGEFERRREAEEGGEATLLDQNGATDPTPGQRIVLVTT
ncbi:MAG: hypothetical protein AAF196_15530 [Planctomycetota bacterium]